MGVRVAYGDRDRIMSAIQDGTIPKDSIIITEEPDKSSGLFFYDRLGELSSVASKDRFSSVEEAIAWVEKYDCAGQALSIRADGGWELYTVQDDGSLSPAASGGGSDHGALINRDRENQHPVQAITGLGEALNRIPPVVEPITNSELEELLK